MIGEAPKRRYAPRKRAYNLDYGRLSHPLPEATPGVIQHASVAWPPARCPKCGNVFLSVDDREAACRAFAAGCGLILYHVRYPEDRP